MKEAKVILPTHDNDGRELSAVHAALARDLCAAFGGYTSTVGNGGWCNGSRVQQEPVAIYYVAGEPTQENNSRLARLIEFHGRKAGQVAVYSVDFNGNAAIVDLKSSEAA